MAFATGARHSLHYIAEVTAGTTPSTPAMTEIPHTGSTIELAKTTFESQELSSDRQIKDSRHGVRRVNGDIPIELAYGVFDDFIEAVTQGTWATNVLKCSTTQRSFSIEETFADIDRYQIHRGMTVNSMTVNATPDAIVTGSFNFLGMNSAVPTSVQVNASAVSVSANSKFDSFTATINEGGSAIAVVTSLDFTIENGLNPTYVIGTAGVESITSGRSRATGNVRAYFENETLYNKFLNETASSLDVTFTDGTSSLKFDFKNVRYNGAAKPVNGEGPVEITMPFIAIYDSSAATNVVITRTP